MGKTISPDGWAHKDGEPVQETQMPPGPFAITSMPVAPPVPPASHLGKLGNTVAGPTGGDDE
jgi:hypothetical protein